MHSTETSTQATSPHVSERRRRTKGPISVAQRVVVTISDDIDGGEAAETVVFALDGKSYEIDLNVANAKKLRKGLAPFVAMRPSAVPFREGLQAHVDRSRPGGRPGLGPVQRARRAASGAHPEAGLRGLQRSPLTPDLPSTPSDRLVCGSRRGARPKSRSPEVVRV